MEKAKIGFFKIKRCGYYHHGQPQAAFCHLPEMLQQLGGWSKGLSLGQTVTFEATESLMPAYLYDLTHYNGDWLLTLWNETPASENGVASVQADGLVGGAEVHINAIQEGSIPGFATYFWVIPDSNVFANLRFQHNLAGHAQLQKYLTGFMARASQHVVWAEEADLQPGFEAEVLGYRATPEDEPAHFYPSFRSEPYAKAGRTDLLRRRVHDITRVRRRTTLQLQSPEDLAAWQWLWRKIKGRPRPAQAEDIAVAYDLRVPVSREEFDEIVRVADDDPENGWDDVGFDVKGFGTTQWLSKSAARDDIEIDVRWRNEEVVDADHLLQQLLHRKQALMRIMED